MSETFVPTDLRTERARTPVNVDPDRPTFSWAIAGDADASQASYRIQVTAGRKEFSDGDVIWDSGRVASDRRVGVRYEGPPLESGERYCWRVNLRAEDGTESAWSDPSWWETGLVAGDWEASWIRRAPRGNDGSFADPQFQQLRREFSTRGEVERARAYVAAFHQCAVWINGEEVGRGQSFCYPDRQYYKTYDVTETIRGEGRNAIGVLGVWMGAGKGRPEGEPGFLVQIAVEYADGSQDLVVTDGEWRTRQAPWQQPAPDRSPAAREPVEVADGRNHAPGWTEPGFEDDHWERPEIVGTHPVEPWGTLVGQRREVVREEIHPEDVYRLESGDYVFDFGRVYAAEPVVEFSDGEDGDRIQMHAGFRLDDEGQVSTTEGVQWTDMRYEYVQRDGRQTFRPFVFLGFRYLQIDDPGEGFHPRETRAIVRRNEVPDERAATFTSSDDTLEEVWELARHSALYGSQEQFLDTPTREKGQFVGDAFDISLATMAAFRERGLTEQAIREFCRSQERYWTKEGRVNAVYPTGEGKRDIPDYTQLLVEWVWQYYLASGDRDLLERAYPVLENIASYVGRSIDDETGLVWELSGGDRSEYRHGIVDWPAEMRYGYDMETAARTTVNVLAVNVFRRLADATAALGRPETTVRGYRTRAAALRSAINSELTRPDGVYVDGLRGDGSQSDHASQHANAYPLAFGLVPEEAVDQVADHVVDQGMSMGPLTVYWLLLALDVADRHRVLVDLVTDPTHDGWADILQRGGTFTWESWKARDLPDDERRRVLSESHAWGATALPAIQQCLLGVRTTAPAASGLSIEPPREGLQWAEGDVPTERGPVSVAWERDGAAGEEPLDLAVSIPRGATATVVLPTPDPRTATVSIDGTEVEAEGSTPDSVPDGVASVETRDGAVACVVTGGRYDFTLDR